MKKTTVWVLLIICVWSLAGLPLAARQEGDLWWGGFSVGSRGYGGGETEPGEYLQLSLFADPLQLNFLNPVLYLDAACSVFPLEPGRFFWGIRMDVSLFTFKNHPGSGFFQQTNWYTPSLTAGLRVAPGNGSLFDGDTLRYTLEIHPLRIRTGDAFYSHLAPILVFDREFGLTEWGISLFQYSFFLF